MKIEHFDSVTILSHLLGGLINSDLSACNEEDREYVKIMAERYPFDRFAIDWKFDSETEFAKCDISGIYGGCVRVEVYSISYN